MTDPASSRRTRITTAVVGGAVAAVVAVTAFGAVRGAAAGDEVVSMRAVSVTATQAGEVGGPAVRFALRVTNTTDAPVSLSDAVVNATAGRDDEPAYPVDSAGTPLPATVPAGGSVSGVYVFTVPAADRGDVTVTLDTSTDNPVVAFSGAAPR